MINLLPQKEKETLHAKQLEKLAIILGIIILTGLLCLYFVLLSVKLYVLGRAAWQKSVFESAQKETESEEFQNFQGIISQHNKDLSRANSFYENQAGIDEVLDVILKLPSFDGLYFTAISLDATQKDKDMVKAVISGFSDTRDNLTLLKKSIEEEEQINNVYFPPESWVNVKNINFNLTMDVLKLKNE